MKVNLSLQWLRIYIFHHHHLLLLLFSLPCFSSLQINWLIGLNLQHFLLMFCDTSQHNGTSKSYEIFMFVSQKMPNNSWLFWFWATGPGAVAQWLLHPGLLTSGPGFNPRCYLYRRKFQPGHKCHLSLYQGPCLSIRPYLGESDIKLIHSSINW